MSQARRAEWEQYNVLVRRIPGGVDAFVTYDTEQEPSRRWACWERVDRPTGTGNTEDELLAAPTREAEALYCRGSTGEEVVAHYAHMKAEQMKGTAPPAVYFRDRHAAGLGSIAPDETPEWKALKARRAAALMSRVQHGADHAAETGERTREQLRATVRNWMAIQGLSPTTKDLREALGIGRLGDNWKGR